MQSHGSGRQNTQKPKTSIVSFRNPLYPLKSVRTSIARNNDARIYNAHRMNLPDSMPTGGRASAGGGGGAASGVRVQIGSPTTLAHDATVPTATTGSCGLLAFCPTLRAVAYSTGSGVEVGP
jgi:hypothetical protein